MEFDTAAERSISSSTTYLNCWPSSDTRPGLQKFEAVL